MDSNSRSSSPLLFVLLTGFFAGILGIRTQLPSADNPKPAQPRSSQAEAKPEATAATEPHSLIRLLQEYAGEEPIKGDKTKKIGFLIATLPDPIDSQLSNLFDSFLDSIQRGAQDAGFTLDRSYFPWTRSREQASASSDGAQPSWQTQPGLLLFRKDIQPNQGDPASNQQGSADCIQDADLLAVFLVGETPTGGIHKKALLKALDEITPASNQQNAAKDGKEENLLSFSLEVNTAKPGNYRVVVKKAVGESALGRLDRPKTLSDYSLQKVCGPIKILGPSFSGSATSLGMALKQWTSKPGRSATKIQIVSGSATAVDSVKLGAAQDTSKDASGSITTVKLGISGHEHNSITFSATLLPDKDSIQVAKVYLNKKRYQTVALLVETGTAYGSTFQEWNEALQLRFPAHISALREAIEKKSADGGTSKTEKNIPAPLGEDSRSQAAPSAFSGFSTSSDELVLNKILSELSQRRIQAVGIVATDVRDTVFLAQEVREHVPGTVIFTFDPDLIYTHPSRTWATYGMLVFGSAPLINRNPVWIAPEKNRQRVLQFSGQGEEGVYNATLELLGQGAKMADDAPPFSRKCDDGDSPVWITAVGRSQILPVAIQCTSEFVSDRSEQKREVSALYANGDHLGFVLTSLAIMGFALTLSFLYYPHALGTGKSRLNLLPVSDLAARALGDPVSPQFFASSRMYLLTCCWVLLIFYLLISLTFMGPGLVTYNLHDWWTSGWNTAVSALPVVTLLALLAACVIVGLAYRTAPQIEKKLRLPTAETVVRTAGALLLLGFAVLFEGKPIWDSLRAPKGRAPESAIFSYVRAFNWSGGFSPLLPMLLIAAAALIWGFSSFRRLRTIDVLLAGAESGTKIERCTFLGMNQSSCEGMDRIEAEIQTMVERPWVVPTAPYILIILLLVLIGLYVLIRRLTPSIEGWSYDWLFALTFLLVYCALLMECTRVWMLWGSLRHYLKRLAAHPLRTAFTRYRQSFQGLPRINFATPIPGLGHLAFSIEQAVKLASLASESKYEPLKHWAATSRSDLCSALQKLSEAMAVDADGPARASVPQRYCIHHSLSNLAASLSPYLECYWIRGAACASGVATGTGQSEKFFALAEEFVAGRAVEFIMYIVPSFRNMGAFVFSGLLLMLFAVVSYPFQPQDLFLTFNWIVILACITGAMTVLVQMERDFILSSLNNTDPGKVTISRDLVLRFVLYGFIPLMALLGAQFPAQLQKITAMFSGGQGGISP